MPYEERPHQTEALNADIAAYDLGIRRMMNVMATGSGKTVIFAKIKERFKSRLPGQQLVLAHTDDLVSQNLAKMRYENPLLVVEKEMAGAYANPNADIISASVATLGRAGTKRISRFNWDAIDKIVIDEAHHSTGDAYGRVLACAGSLNPGTNKLLLGVTATSQRPDGKSLSDIFEKVAYSYPLRQAITENWLVPIRGFRVATDTSLENVSVHGGDFAKGELSQTVNTPARNRRVVQSWLKLAADRKTMAFTVDIEHAEDLASAFRQVGVKAEAIWGDDPEREAKTERHQRGATQVVCNCNLFVEGYDDPSITCIVLARPTESELLFQQMVGRGTRLHPSKLDLLVIDMVDMTKSHSLITLPTLMGLSNTLDIQGHNLLEVVEQLEAVQAENPTLDLTKLKDIDDLKTFVQTVNMFEIRFPKEVEENSELIWYKAIDGGYKILVPKDGPERAGFMRLYENPLGQWDIKGRIKDIFLNATRPTMEEAFKASDEQIRKRLGTMRLSYLLRTATWHGKKVTIGQKTMLTRLFPKREFAWDLMNSGQASKIISERLARKVTK